MDAPNRIEQALETALALGTGDGNPGCPPKLAAGLRHNIAEQAGSLVTRIDAAL